MQHIGSKIADIRETAGMTQSDLAKKMKTTQSAIARLESGRQNVSADMLNKIGRALGKNLITLSPGTVNISITGNKKLSGTIQTNTSKNGAVALLCASLMNKGTTTLHNVPRIEEVHRIIEVLESIGMKVDWKDTTMVLTPPKKFNLKNIDAVAARRTRSIVMFIGSLMHNVNSFSLPQSGGCKLGSRTVKPHFYTLQHFGVDIETTEDAFKVSQKPKVPTELILYESGDTVTETARFAAAGRPDTTVI
jgi:UDP-N-acetylglucosamine 1-carboxyvinyltransferase